MKSTRIIVGFFIGFAVQGCQNGELSNTTLSSDSSAAASAEQVGESSTREFIAHEVIVEALQKLPDSEYDLPKLMEMAGFDGPPVEYDYDSSTGISLVDISNEKIDVDLRTWDTPIKNQGTEGACTAFATVAVMENVAKQKTGLDFDLSEQHLWSLQQNQGYITAATGAASISSLVSEAVWPYGSSEPQNIENKGVMRIAETGQQKDFRSLTLSYLVQRFQEAKKPLVFGVHPTPDFDKIGFYTGTSRPGAIGHAMAVVGMKATPGNDKASYFILKNSWGEDAGDKGYVYLPFSYCRQHSCFMQMVRDVIIDGSP